MKRFGIILLLTLIMATNVVYAADVPSDNAKSKSEEQNKEYKPGDIAKEDYDTLTKAHNYYVNVLGVGCSQCGIPQRDTYGGDYGNQILAHGDKHNDKAPGESSYWILMKDTKTLIVNGTGDTYDWKYGNSVLEKKYGKYEKKKYKKGKHAWEGYEDIPEIVIYGEKMENIGKATFSNLRHMKEFHFCGDKVIHIGDFAFYDSHELPQFTIAPSVKTIGRQCFVLSRKLTSFDFNAKKCKLRSIGARAFKNTPLKSFTCPRRLKWIDYAAFSGCSKLETINWNKVDIRVSDYAFNNCKSLGYTQIHFIPSNVKLRGKYCFNNCT